MRTAFEFSITNWRRSAVALMLCLLASSAIAAMDPFVVRDMRVEGLQRISEGTVFNYLPINIGDTVDQVRVREAIRALYTQAPFDDIELRRENDTLIVAVRERPSIESFEIEGNKDIKTEDLMESLRGVGLAKGRTFDRSVLDNYFYSVTFFEADFLPDPDIFYPFPVRKLVGQNLHSPQPPLITLFDRDAIQANELFGQWGYTYDDQVTLDAQVRLRHGHGHTQEEMYAIKYD